MAAHQSILFLALLLVTTSSLIHGFKINGKDVVEATIRGRLTCTAPGTKPLPNSPGIAGVNVTVVLKSTDGIIYDPSLCLLKVKLPLAACKVFPPTGTLYAVPALTGLVELLLTCIASYELGPFSLGA
ncbi:hypothetical protein Pint_18381 [Pistacia integerrima]|uniref:Uncharacterized protein n=1 Tax=Pistacia integerrima TaxID=434235 RepID=A0ACC0YX57_9ROSI|nr:hypothetical protein Pint_18381 [Pistacia integerrima]